MWPRGPAIMRRGVKGQSMSERKAAGIDKPGPGPCERESEELLLLYNEKLQETKRWGWSQIWTDTQRHNLSICNILGLQKSVDPLVDPPEDSCFFQPFLLSQKASGVHWPRLIGDVMTVCELSVYWPLCVCVYVCVLLGRRRGLSEAGMQGYITMRS